MNAYPRGHLVKPWAKPPRNARRVYQGSVFSVYRWRKKTFSGRFTTYEAFWRPAGVNIIAMVGRKVLRTRERPPGIRGWYLGCPKDAPRKARRR
jgi:hypothetical protein